MNRRVGGVNTLRGGPCPSGGQRGINAQLDPAAIAYDFRFINLSSQCERRETGDLMPVSRACGLITTSAHPG